MVVTPLGMPGWGRQRLGTSADPRHLASAKHLPWHGKEDWEGYCPLLSRTAYTTSEPWQQQTVSACWPERTKSSVGVTLGKSELMLELIPIRTREWDKTYVASDAAG